MGVQIPKVERFGPSASPTPSEGRINVDIKNPLKTSGLLGEATMHFAAEIGDEYVKGEAIAADTISTQYASEFHRDLENRLEGPDGAKRVKGDPTEAYQKYDEDTKLKYEEILSKAAGYSEATRAAVKAKLDNTEAKFYDRKVSAYGNQLNTFQTNVTNDAVALLKNDMMDNTAHLDISDVNATTALDNTISQIEDQRIKMALKNGSGKAILNEQGQVTGYDLNPSVNLQIAKDISDGLTKSINNLIAAGDVEGAEYLMNKYGNRIDNVNKDKVVEKTKKASIESKGMAEFDKVRNMNSEAALSRLEKIQDPKVREQAIKNLDTHTRMVKNLTDRASKNSYNELTKYIMEKQKSNPYIDVNALEKDPMYKRLSDTITDAKQLTAIRHMVEQPKVSNQKAKSDLYNDMFNGKLSGMSYEDFSEKASNLDKKDRQMFETQWKKYNQTTPTEEYQMTKSMGADLNKQLQSLGYVKKNEYGKYSNADQIKLNQAYDELIDVTDKLPPGATYKERLQFVQKFAADKVKGQVFQAPELRASLENAEARAEAISRQPVESMSLEQQRPYMREFKRQRGRMPTPGSGELSAFIKEQQAKQRNGSN